MAKIKSGPELFVSSVTQMAAANNAQVITGGGIANAMRNHDRGICDMSFALWRRLGAFANDAACGVMVVHVHGEPSAGEAEDLPPEVHEREPDSSRVRLRFGLPVACCAMCVVRVCALCKCK